MSFSAILLGIVFVCSYSWLDTQSLQRELIRIEIIKYTESSNDPVLKQKAAQFKAEIQTELDWEIHEESEIKASNRQGINFNILFIGCIVGMLLYFAFFYLIQVDDDRNL